MPHVDDRALSEKRCYTLGVNWLHAIRVGLDYQGCYGRKLTTRYARAMNDPKAELDSEPSRATVYRRKAAVKDKFPVPKCDFYERAQSFSYTLDLPAELQMRLRVDLDNVFTKTFGQPAKSKSPSTVFGRVRRFGDQLEKFLYTYKHLDAQERGTAELVMLSEDNNFVLADRMEELARLSQDFRAKLEQIRDAGGMFPRKAGPEFDPRVRTLVLHLENLYRRYFDLEITMSKSVDGTYRGPFITFCRAACEHFLPPNFVNGPTLEQAVFWVIKGP